MTPTIDAPQTPPPGAEVLPSRPRRLAEAALFVALWMGMGTGLRLDANGYLLLGVPLTLAFQILVRRQPVRALWVRAAPPFRWDAPTLLLAAALAALPLWTLAATGRGMDPLRAAWFVCAVLGAVPAAYALRQSRGATLAAFGGCAATAGALGVSLFLLARAASPAPHAPFSPLLAAHESLLYFPVVFVLEEVTFRGLLDAHVHQPGERRGWPSALFVSALWGAWHFPIAPGAGDPVARLVELVVFHSLLGVPLSLFWRRSGNLAVPGAVHALVDGVRNALGLF